MSEKRMLTYAAIMAVGIAIGVVTNPEPEPEPPYTWWVDDLAPITSKTRIK